MRSGRNREVILASPCRATVWRIIASSAEVLFAGLPTCRFALATSASNIPRPNVRFGSLADKPFRAEIHLCPLLSKSGKRACGIVRFVPIADIRHCEGRLNRKGMRVYLWYRLCIIAVVVPGQTFSTGWARSNHGSKMAPHQTDPRNQVTPTTMLISSLDL